MKFQGGKCNKWRADGKSDDESLEGMSLFTWLQWTKVMKRNDEPKKDWKPPSMQTTTTMDQGPSILNSLQQKVSLYAKWFHWILSEFTGPSERDLMGM
jgi:hypothetical protein